MRRTKHQRLESWHFFDERRRRGTSNGINRSRLYQLVNATSQGLAIYALFRFNEPRLLTSKHRESTIYQAMLAFCSFRTNRRWLRYSPSLSRFLSSSLFFSSRRFVSEAKLGNRNRVASIANDRERSQTKPRSCPRKGKRDEEKKGVKRRERKVRWVKSQGAG